MPITYDTGSAVTAAANTTTPSTTGFTTATGDELIIAVCCAADNNTAAKFTSTALASSGYVYNKRQNPLQDALTQNFSNTTPAGSDTGLTVTWGIKTTAGATGDISCTQGANSRHVMIAGAFKVDQKSDSPLRKIRRHQHMMVR